MKWPQVELGEVLQPVKDSATIIPQRLYRQITVRLFGKGVIERGKIVGSDIGSKQYTASEGQFIISKIDARNGAFGLVPQELDGAVVTGDFLLFKCAQPLEPKFLAYLSTTPFFVDECVKSSVGSTNRVRLNPTKFMGIKIPLPPLSEQQRLTAKLEQVQTTVAEIKRLRTEQQNELRLLLRRQFREAIADAPRLPLGQVAPIVRRPVEVDTTAIYPELGVRSFGRGTFHKPPTIGADVTWQKPYWLRADDLLFSNIKAWEGAVAVVAAEDDGRIASHRYITCVADPSVALSRFLLYYLLTPEGIEKINDASPGTADRNRTLGTAALNKIEVPVPSLATQQAFLDLQTRIDMLTTAQNTAQEELGLLLPAALDKAFKGEL
ncbi:restriction endonuclease subunit S [Hymenobacter lutimineralis]|uniref:Restriction endonuclease subunit S n=1 Tax=Hymenobacter lutimineralis TaxID=2606448 RepID=A0A5D6VA23_9BACT|nr:restriction endonuclease subunit S [Hymenobacter lutimineralis]TYZ12713.1 restriction endonuclease subunit S [Hymenobacter lutimineralis]